jgi:hypothetical protein
MFCSAVVSAGSLPARWQTSQEVSAVQAQLAGVCEGVGCVGSVSTTHGIVLRQGYSCCLVGCCVCVVCVCIVCVAHVVMCIFCDCRMVVVYVCRLQGTLVADSSRTCESHTFADADTAGFIRLCVESDCSHVVTRWWPLLLP